MNTNDSIISCVIDISQFSNLQQPLQVTAHVLRFLNNRKARLSPDNQQLLPGSETGAKDMEEAEHYWILDVQISLQQNKKFENWRREFNLFNWSQWHSEVWRLAVARRPSLLSRASHSPWCKSCIYKQCWHEECTLLSTSRMLDAVAIFGTMVSVSSTYLR